VKIAVLFPGQGAQYVGMGKEIYNQCNESKEIFDKAAQTLSWDVREVCFEDKDDKINQTRYTQASLFTTNIAIYEALKSKGLQIDAVLGFSLGEYSAIYASGSLSFEQTLELVEKRAVFMENCATNNPGGMSAVLGIDVAKIDEICKMVTNESYYVAVANDNCEGQVTISGIKEGVEKASILLKEAGAKRVLPLQVSGAFHSNLMEGAADNMKVEVANINFANPICPIISNVTAKEMNSAQEIIENIPMQIMKGVRFRESMLYLAEQGFDTFIEVGPKRTLSNLVKKILPEAQTLQVEDPNGIENIMQEIGENQC
jgi:[acyl-carrier-protein] S-malonyltransferase